MDDNELEKRAELSSHIYGFLKEAMLEYDREGFSFNDFLADIPYAIAFIMKEINEYCEEDEDDGKGTE